jgi:hypothetical protein
MIMMQKASSPTIINKRLHHYISWCEFESVKLYATMIRGDIHYV